MIISILSTIFGTAILIGIVLGIFRSIIEAFPVVGIVFAVVLAIIVIAAVSYALYRLVIFLKGESPKEVKAKRVKKENQLDFLDDIKKDEENQRNFWEE